MDTLRDRKGSVSLGGRTITHLGFSIVDGQAEEDKICVEKTKLMTDNITPVASTQRSN